MHSKMIGNLQFPEFTGLRCLMMPYIQGDSKSVPQKYLPYKNILEEVFIRKGDLGFLTIDESIVNAGVPHRGARAKTSRALHTEVGKKPGKIYCWGGGGWGTSHKVELDKNVRILLANNLDNSCAVWNQEHLDTSNDGDIGYASDMYPYKDAIMMQAGEIFNIGILTPHESLPVKKTINRQFLRIISSGVYGRETYFTINPLVKAEK